MPATTEATSQMTDTWYEKHWPNVIRTAAREHRKATIFTTEDMEQAIWEHALGNWSDYAEADDALVSTLMTRAARTYANKQRIEHMYATGSFIYTPKLVAAYLDSCVWSPVEEVPDVDARVDLQEAFAELSKSAPKQAGAVFKRYGLGEELSATERPNLSRGIESLTHKLNSGLRLQAESVEYAIAGEN
ncbi:hypothetical protein J2X12_002911 [Pseudarthrobacter oxydans]|uniref:Uncharacterized protein n=1 Tax=Pseudarthrobacter oxydans TaxID=1671 RepID=A0AAW8NFQ8_PSEOX|nr:hypothetical protein [Pseudarthrobacter oxydans]MDR6794352.1 hypothetical protein [Pseudarthrobacter oxydans]MDR7164873.1 hypothetical protein [Pseudarthrobacter oxydans]